LEWLIFHTADFNVTLGVIVWPCQGDSLWVRPLFACWALAGRWFEPKLYVCRTEINNENKIKSSIILLGNSIRMNFCGTAKAVRQWFCHQSGCNWNSRTYPSVLVPWPRTLSATLLVWSISIHTQKSRWTPQRSRILFSPLPQSVSANEPQITAIEEEICTAMQDSSFCDPLLLWLWGMRKETKPTSRSLWEVCAHAIVEDDLLLLAPPVRSTVFGCVGRRFLVLGWWEMIRTNGKDFEEINTWKGSYISTNSSRSVAERHL